MHWSSSPTAQTLRRSPASCWTQLELRTVGVLELVDQQVAEPADVAAQHLGVLAESRSGQQEQVVEVHRALRLQRALVEREHLGGGEVVRRSARRPPAWARARPAFFAREMAVRIRRGSKSSCRRCAARAAPAAPGRSGPPMSAMANFRGQPSRWMCWRSTSAPKAWKVQTVSACAPCPTRRTTRSFISAAALLVKVTARMARAGDALVEQLGDAVGDDPRLPAACPGEDQQRALRWW